MTREPYHLRQFARDVRRDVDAYLGFWGEYHAVRAGWRHRLSALLTPSVTACVLYRVARLAWSHGLRQLGIAIARLNFASTRVTIHPANRIGGGLYIPHPATGIVFEGEAGTDLTLFAGAAVLAMPPRPFPCHDAQGAPRLGDGVALGSKALVRGPVHVGSGARIGFNTCVTRDVPPGANVVARRSPQRVAARRCSALR